MSHKKNLNEISALFQKREHRAKLLRIASRIAPDEPEDALQDGLVQALTNAAGFREECQTSTWLYRVVVNAALMHRRKARRAARYAQAATRSSADAPWATGGQPQEQPDSQLSRREDIDRVRAAVRELPALYREALEELTMAERHPAQAASDLGITRSCLRTRATRARQQLAQRLRAA